MRATRGVALLEGLIALLVLSVGLLGLAAMQARLVAGSTAAQQRIVATALVDRLLSHALADAGNVGCYLVPAPTGAPACGSAAAADITAQWQADLAVLGEATGSAVLVTLPMAAGSFTGSAQQLRARVEWRNRAGGDWHRVEALTDVR